MPLEAADEARSSLLPLAPGGYRAPSPGSLHSRFFQEFMDDAAASATQIVEIGVVFSLLGIVLVIMHNGTNF